MNTPSDPSGAIEPDRLVALTRELIAIPSVNPFGGPATRGFRERELAERYGELLSEIGCAVELVEVAPGRPNVWGVRPGRGTGPTVMLAGHLDTVGVAGYDSPFDPRVGNRRIHGRGSCDMKAALAAFIEVGRVLDRHGVELAGDLVIAGTADEEDRMLGSIGWADHGPRPDYCIVGEPTNLAVCPAHKGQLGMYIRTFGTAVHSSLRDRGVNAIEKMAAVIDAFADYNDELTTRPPHPLCGHGSFSIGTIRGGDVMSTVPDFCEIEADRRMIPGETAEQVLTEYRQRLDALAAADPAFRHELDGPTMVGGVLDTETDNAVVTAVIEACTAVTGHEPRVEAFTGATDAPNFGCPAVIIGPGSLAQAHGLDEYVEIDEIVSAAHIYLRAVLALAG